MIPSPDEAAERVEQLIILTDRLTALVAEQAKAFEARRPQDAAVHVEETSRLANLYRHESARVRGNPGLISASPAPLRLRLRRATEAFDAVLARQARAVGAVKHRHRGSGPRHRRGDRRPAAEGRQLRRPGHPEPGHRRHRHHPEQAGVAKLRRVNGGGSSRQRRDGGGK